MRDEKLHAVAAQSTFRSQNVQNTPGPGHFWKLRCRNSARRCGAKRVSKSKCTKHLSCGHLWKLGCRKSARRCGAKHISKSKVQKTEGGTEHFWTFRCRFAWQAQGIVHVVKSEQNARVCSISNKDDRRGRFEEDLQRCISRGRRNAKDMFIRAVRRSGR